MFQDYDDGLDEPDRDDDHSDYYDRDERDGADFFDEADYEYRKAEEAYWEHCEHQHEGQHCDCREPLRYRLKGWLTGIWCTLRAWWRRYEPPFSDEPPF